MLFGKDLFDEKACMRAGGETLEAAVSFDPTGAANPSGTVGRTPPRSRKTETLKKVSHNSLSFKGWEAALRGSLRKTAR